MELENFPVPVKLKGSRLVGVTTIEEDRQAWERQLDIRSKQLELEHADLNRQLAEKSRVAKQLRDAAFHMQSLALPYFTKLQEVALLKHQKNEDTAILVPAEKLLGRIFRRTKIVGWQAQWSASVGENRLFQALTYSDRFGQDIKGYQCVTMLEDEAQKIAQPGPCPKLDYSRFVSADQILSLGFEQSQLRLLMLDWNLGRQISPQTKLIQNIFSSEEATKAQLGISISANLDPNIGYIESGTYVTLDQNSKEDDEFPLNWELSISYPYHSNSFNPELSFKTVKRPHQSLKLDRTETNRFTLQQLAYMLDYLLTLLPINNTKEVDVVPSWAQNLHLGPRFVTANNYANEFIYSNQIKGSLERSELLEKLRRHPKVIAHESTQTGLTYYIPKGTGMTVFMEWVNEYNRVASYPDQQKREAMLERLFREVLEKSENK